MNTLGTITQGCLLEFCLDDCDDRQRPFYTIGIIQ